MRKCAGTKNVYSFTRTTNQISRFWRKQNDIRSVEWFVHGIAGNDSVCSCSSSGENPCIMAHCGSQRNRHDKGAARVAHLDRRLVGTFGS